MSRGEWDALQRNEKALPFSKELLICCLWQEQYPGAGRLRWVMLPLSALAPQPWAQGAVGSVQFGTQAWDAVSKTRVNISGGGW